MGEAQEALADKDRRLKEVELKLLSTTQEMAANAGDYAERMRAKDNEIEQYKVHRATATRPLPSDQITLRTHTTQITTMEQ